MKTKTVMLLGCLLFWLLPAFSFASYGTVSVNLCGSGYVGNPYTPPSANYTDNGTGATERSQPGESDHPGFKHNISMDDTELARAGTDSYNRKWTFYHGQVPTVNIRTRLHNKTNHEIGKNEVTIKWYESPNKTFNPVNDHHFATDHNKKSIGKFKHNSHSDELVERKTGITYLKTLNPGIYYLYPVFYYNGEENMASKNDHGEYIKVTILPRYDVEATQFTANKSAVTTGENFVLAASVRRNYDYLPHDVRVGFYISGNNLSNKLFFAKIFTPNQLGSQTFTIPTLAPLTPGNYTITMKVDDEGILGEINEGNNQRSFNLQVNLPPINGTVDTNFGSTDPNNPKEVSEELTEGHCFFGTSTTLLGMGVEGNPWQWTCQGENGGTSETGYAILMENDDAFRADVNGDGSITSADAMLTSRYAMGLDMSQTDWVDTPTTGDVNCDGNTTSTDANLLLRKAMGMDMSQTDWCVEE